MIKKIFLLIVLITLINGCSYSPVHLIKGDDIEMSVISNMAVQAALCRIHYRRDRHSIPSWDDLEGQAKYWKRVYNTNLGRGTVKHFIKANEDDGFDKSSFK